MYIFSFPQLNNTALGQVMVLPSPGSAEYNRVLQKIMNCHVCLGKTSVFAHKHWRHTSNALIFIHRKIINSFNFYDKS